MHKTEKLQAGWALLHHQLPVLGLGASLAKLDYKTTWKMKDLRHGVDLAGKLWALP